MQVFCRYHNFCSEVLHVFLLAFCLMGIAVSSRPQKGICQVSKPAVWHLDAVQTPCKASYLNFLNRCTRAIEELGQCDILPVKLSS